MNAVSKVLRIVAILGAVAAGVFFYLTQNKVTELQADLDSAKTAAANAANKAKTDLDEANAKADKLDADARDLNRKLQAATQEAKDQEELKTQAVQQLSSIQAQVRAREQTITDLQQKAAAAGTAQTNTQELENKIAGLESENSRFQAEIEKMKTEGVAVKPRVNPNSDVKLEGPSQPVTILSVDPKIGLILIDAGTDKKVGEGNTFQLQKDKTVLGTVVVSQSGADYSIATITGTGTMSASDFYKQVKKGLTLDAVQAE